METLNGLGQVQLHAIKKRRPGYFSFRGQGSSEIKTEGTVQTRSLKWIVATISATLLYLAPELLHAQTTAATPARTTSRPTPYAIVSRDANSRVWQRTNWTQGASGEWVPHVHNITELANGLCYKDGNGNYVDSSETIALLPDGTAAATNCATPVYFPADIGSGLIRLVTTDGSVQQSVPSCLIFDDGTNAVLLGAVTNSVGQLVGSNQVIYRDAFAGIRADLRYTCTKAGLEQDVILREQPPSPASLGLAGSSSIQFLTEFFNTPDPEPIAEPDGVAGGNGDPILRFGSMQMLHGKAFFGGRESGSGPGAAPVWKNWQHIAGRTFLVEEVPYARLKGALNALPVSSMNTGGSPFRKFSKNRALPPLRVADGNPPKAPTKKASITRVAKEDLRQGLVLDYYEINTNLSNFTFANGNTYFISGPVSCENVTFQGGTVIKYPNNEGAYLSVQGTVKWQTGPYQPAILTAADDDSVGDTLNGMWNGYTGTIQPGGYAEMALQTVAPMHDVRIAYAKEAVAPFWGAGVSLTNVQIVGSVSGVTLLWSGGKAYLENCLFANMASNAIAGGGPGSAYTLYFCTIDNCPQFAGVASDNTAPENIYSVDSIFSNIGDFTGGTNKTGAYNGFCNTPNNYTFGVSPLYDSSSSDIFDNSLSFWWGYQSGVTGLGYANYYLVSGSPFSGVGTSSSQYVLDPAVLPNIRTKTTQGPTTFSSFNNNSTQNQTLGQQVALDTKSAPDLGYHYDRMDCVFGNDRDENYFSATLTIQPGVVAGWSTISSGSSPGMFIQNGGSIIFEGTADNPCYFVRCDTVWESDDSHESTGIDSLSTSYPSVTATFTHFVAPDYEGTFFGNSTNTIRVTAYNCEFWNGQFCEPYTGMIFGLVNCLLDEPALQFWSFSNREPSVLTFTNCTFTGGFNGTVFSMRSWPVSAYNCAFDGYLAESTNGGFWGGNIQGDYNAFTQGSLPRSLAGPHDVTVTNFTWQTGPLGAFYQTTNSPLIDKGSVTADVVGLCNFTTQTNQTEEAMSIIDIGYHYIALDQYGNILDSDDDCLPDSWELQYFGTLALSGTNLDCFGNTLMYDYENGLGALAVPVITSQPTSATNKVGDSVNFTVFATNNPPVLYQSCQWVCNGTNISGATNTNLTLSNVQFSNAGSYWAVVSSTGGMVESAVAQLSVVGVSRIIEDGIVPEVSGSASIPTNSTINLRVISSGNPPTTNFPPGEPVWAQLSGRSLTLPAAGTNVASFTPTTPGQYVISASCGTSSNIFTLTVVDGSDSNYNGIPDSADLAYAPQVWQTELGSWRFDTPDWAGIRTTPEVGLAIPQEWIGVQGQLPISYTNILLVSGWSVGALEVNSNNGPAWLLYPEINTNSSIANINCQQGSIRFWFRPDWSSANEGGTGPQTEARLVEIGQKGTSNGCFGVYIDPTGTNLYFCTQTNSASILMPVTNLAAAIGWTSGTATTNWHHLTLTYSITNSILYIDGTQAAVGGGVTNWPGPGIRSQGFSIGNAPPIGGPGASTNWAQGRFDNFETFNYVLGPNYATNYYETHSTPLAGRTNFCQLAPLAVNFPLAQTLTNGQIVTATNNGSGSGNFGWLNWAGGNSSANTLAGYLANLDSITNYINPDGSGNNVLSIEGWVSSTTGVKESLAQYLNAYTNYPGATSNLIGVVLWDGQDANHTEYQVAGFANIALISFNLNSPQSMTFSYQGARACNAYSNQPPICNIVSPTNNQVFTVWNTNSPATIRITAAASDPEDGLVSVAFYSSTNPSVLGTNIYYQAVTNANTNLFTYIWTNAPHGSNYLTAIATDEFGATNMSPRITNIVNWPPQVYAGPNIVTNLPLGATNTLAGTITDDGLPSHIITNIQWSVISSNGPVTLTSPNATNTQMIVTTSGTYVLQLSASDGAVTGTNTCTIIVRPQPSISITSPTNGAILAFGAPITLSATAYDLDGIVTNVQFFNGTTFIGNAIQVSSNSYTYIWRNAPDAVVSLTAVATDNDGQTNSATISFVVNRPPQVNVGPTQIITLPLTNVTMAAAVTDDGLPPGAPVTTTWSVVSGNGPVNFSPNAHATNATASFVNNGIYMLKLTADDSVATNSATVTVVVNKRPQVSAGANRIITLTGSSVTATLAGSVTDDGLPPGAPVTGCWSVVSGTNGTVTFANSNAFTTTATFTNSGGYILQLTVNDTVSTNSSQVTEIVNRPPVVSAGTNQTLVWVEGSGNISTNLTGSFSDDGYPYGTNGATWSEISGPGTVSFSPNNATTNATATFSTNGIYVLQLLVTDGSSSISNQCVVTVERRPMVSIISPTNNATFSPGATITNVASAFGFNSSVTNVLFYDGTNLLGAGTPAIPISGRVGWWRGEGNAYDSASTNNGTTYNVTYTNGMVGTAFAFDPENHPGSYVGIKIPDQPAFVLTNALSVEGWIRPRGVGSAIFWRGDERPGLDPFALSMQGSNGVVFYITDPSGNSASVSTNIVDNQWLHVAGTFNASSSLLQLYVNGTLASQTNTSLVPIGNLLANQCPAIGIGNVADCNNNFPFLGDVDEIALYNRALSATEVQSIYNAGTNNPFTFIWTNAPAGTNTLTAVAIDNDGLMTTSAPVNITVVSSSLSVQIVSPINQIFLSQTDATVTAIASDAETNISTVQFFAQTNGGQPISIGYAFEPLNGPYQVPWPLLQRGTYILTAKATDARGSNVWSAPVTNFVRDVPKVNITSPTNGQLFLYPPTNITITATAVTDPATSITNVTFYLGTNYQSSNIIGVATSGTGNSYSIIRSNVTGGVYTIAARAFDAEGGIGRSYSVTFAVRTNQPPRVYAGPDQIVELSTNPVQLAGMVIDDGLPSNYLAIAWSKFSGPGTAVFSSLTNPASTVTFTNVGTYVLQLSASDGQYSVTNSVTIMVLECHAPPIPHAGTNHVLVLPALVNTNPFSTIKLTKIATDFDSPISVDYYVPSNQVIMSVHYGGGGIPWNFELVDSNGVHRQFSSISNLGNEVYIATVRDSLGHFDIGDMFTGNGQPGEIMRIRPDGTTIGTNGVNGIAWAVLPTTNLPNGITVTPGLLRGGVWVDRTGVWGGDLIVATTAGDVWRVNASAEPTLVAQLSGGDAYEGITTIPGNVQQYGPWAGRILVGGDSTTILAVDTNGATANYDLGIGDEDIRVIPGNENFFGVDYGASTLYGATPFEFQGMAGDILFADEGSDLHRVRWNGTGFDVFTINQQASSYEGVNFAPAGIANITPVDYVQLDGWVGGTCSSNTVFWSLESGPGPVSFDNPALTNTLARFTAPGTNYLRMTVSNADFISYDDTRVDVIRNQAPQVNAGTDFVTSATVNIPLSGSVTDDGWPDHITNSWWELVEGPTPVTFAQSNQPQTTVTVPGAGIYVFRLNAYDGDATSSAEVTVTVAQPSLTLYPPFGWPTDTNTPYTITALLVDEFNNPLTNVIVSFSISSGLNTNIVTDSNGIAVLTYSAAGIAQDTIGAKVTIDSVDYTATAYKDWAVPLGCGLYSQFSSSSPSLLGWDPTDPHYANFYIISGVAGTPISLSFQGVDMAAVLRNSTNAIVATAESGLLNYTPLLNGNYLLEMVNLAGNNPSYELAPTCNSGFLGAPAIQFSTNNITIPEGATIGFDNGTGTNVPVDEYLNIYNPGGADLVVRDILISGDFTNLTGTFLVIPPGTSTNLILQFNASSNGYSAGELVLEHNAPGGTNHFALLGAAFAAEIQVSAAGQQIPNGNSTVFPQTSPGHPTNLVFTIENDGTANLVISNVLLAGDFQNLTGTNLVVPPNGGTTNLNIQFNATSSGFAGGELVLQDNAKGEYYVIYLSAGAAPAGDAPSVGLSITAPPHAPTNVTMDAYASSSSANIARVDFLQLNTNGTTLLFSTNNPNAVSSFDPEFIWMNVPPGTYTVAAVGVDSAGRSQMSAPVQFTLTTNVPPVAVDQVFTVPMDSVNNILYVLNNDSDADGDNFVVTNVTQPLHGSVVIADYADVSYTPPANVYGFDQFSYTISDGWGGFASANVFIIITNQALAGAPQIGLLYNGTNVSDGGTIVFPSTSPQSPTNILVTVTNLQVSPLQINLATNSGDFALSNNLTGARVPGFGSTNLMITFNASSNGLAEGQLLFEYNAPNAGGFGPNYLVYLVGDAFPTGAPPAVVITTPTNSEYFYSPATIYLTALVTPGITNVSYVTFEQLTTNGPVPIATATIGANNLYGINWANVSDGTYTIIAQAVDVEGRSSTASPVTIQVLPSNGNKPPVAGACQYTVFADSFNNLFYPLTNCSDPDGDTLKIIGATIPGNGGTATVLPGGIGISYSPAGGFSSTDPNTGIIYPGDGFDYVISDGHGNTATNTIIVDVFATAKPTVVLTASNYTVNAGVIDPLYATVSPFIYITNVQFFYGTTLLGQLTNGIGGVYTLNWTADYKNCNCAFTAVAMDQFGQLTTSDPIHITVNPPTNGPGGSSIGPDAVYDNYVGSSGPLPFTNKCVIRDGMFNLYGRAYHPLGSNDVVWSLGVYTPDGETLLRDFTPTPTTNGYYRSIVGSATSSNILADCDLTTLQNGVYLMRLTVTAGFMTTNLDVQFVLDSNLKIGQFSFNQQDLIIPVSGIPLTVVRTYNSLNPNLGDFGYSWTYAINAMDVQLDETRQDITIGGGTANFDLDGGDTDPPQNLSIRSGGDRDITLTLPGGQRTTFSYSLVPNGDDANALYNAIWTPPAGVTATLTTLNPAQGAGSIGDNTLFADPTGQLAPMWPDGGDGSTMDNYDMPGWVLKTLNGTKYYITRGDPTDASYQDDSGLTINVTAYGPPKLTRIEDLNGNVIKISDQNIQSYHNGNLTHTVLINRNNSGLISAIYDSNGLDASGNPIGLPAVLYQYDSRSNLIAAARLTDTNTGTYLTNTYTYANPNFPHYITGMTSGDGTQVARNEYDDQGHLTATVDANGNRTEYHNDPNGQIQVKIDSLMHTNSYVYDLKGNIIWTTNALGTVNRSVYGDPNNPSLETAITNAYGTAGAIWALRSYDQNGNLTNAVSMGHTNVSTYDNNGNLTFQQDPLGNHTINLYDDDNNLTNTTQYDVNNNPVGGSSSIYENGRLTQMLDANGQPTMTLSYDDAGNVTNSIDANGLAHGAGYDANGRKTNSWYQWIPPGGGSPVTVSTSTEYDSSGRIIQTIDALGNTNFIFYTANGAVDYTVDKFGNTNSFLYDAQGRMIQTTYPNGTFTQTVYDNLGRAHLTTDRNGITGTITDFDAGGQATNEVRLANVTINIAVDPQNQGHYMSTPGSTGVPLSTNSTVYNALGQVSSQTSPDGTSYFAYYPDGQLMHQVDALGDTNFYAYDDSGRQTNVVDALKHSTTLQYDGLGRNVATIFDNNTATTNIFDNLSHRVGIVDQAKLLTQFKYSVSGQLTNVIGPAVPDPENNGNLTNAAWSYFCDTYGHQFATMDPKGRATTNFFDAFGRRLSQRLPMAQTNFVAYNSLGQVATNYDFKGQRTEFYYDRYGRVTNKFYFVAGQTHPSNAVFYAYNQLDQLTNLTERYGSDAANSYASVSGPQDRLFASRSRHSLRAAFVPVVASAPKLGGPLLALIAFCSIFTLVPGGRRLRKLLADYYLRGGWKVAHIPRFSVRPISPYKLARWMPSYFWRSASVFTLICLIASDQAFQRFWIARADCPTPQNFSTLTTRITTFAYDFDGRLQQANTPEGVINYGYDLATGRLTSTCTANSEIDYTYDALGRLETVHVTKRNGAPVDETTTYKYDPVGNRSEVDLPNNVVTKYQYDDLNHLTNMTHTVGTTTYAIYSYILDKTGRRTNAMEVLRQEAGSGSTYQTNMLSWQFDGMYRLTNEISVSTSSGGRYAFTNAYQYGIAGNRLRETRTGGNAETVTYAYDANDELMGETNAAVTTTYLYDVNGSLTNKAAGTANVRYTYDLMNKLSSVDNGTVQESFQYNDHGIRVRTMTSTSAKYYLIDANNHTGSQQALEELNVASGNSPILATSYVLGDDVLAQATGSSQEASYLLYDGHSSTRQMVDNSGTVTSRYNYEAYGAVQTATSTSSAEDAVNNNGISHLYCGEQYDSVLQMYNLRARFYNPGNGRFNQRDTFQGHNEDPQSLHKYAYANSDPVDGMDPTGQFTLIDLMAVITIISIATAILLPGLTIAKNKAIGRSVIDNGEDPVQYEIDKGDMPSKGEFLSMDPDMRQTMVAFWQRNGEWQKEVNLVRSGNTILTANMVQWANDGANAADLGLGGVVGMAHAFPFVPNPWGRLGDPVTRATIAACERDFQLAGFQVDREVRFMRGPLAFKDRYADLFAIHPVTGESYIVNVGKMTQTGIPIMRERLALDDIIFSPDLKNNPIYFDSRLLYIQKGATGLPPGWNW